MFPHPQNLITVRAMEREQALAEVARMRRHAPGLPHRSRAPKLSLLRRAARAVAMLAG
jgi:hypothetical protein